VNTDIFQKIREKVSLYEQEIYDFASELIRIESFSGKEGNIAEYITEKMRKLGYDSVDVDDMGNVCGTMGTIKEGQALICVDGHMDVVEYGELAQWTRIPNSGEQDEENIYGRGATDMKSAIAAMIYVGCILKDLKLNTSFCYMACATVQEEPCEGLSWEYLIEKKGIKPSVVILGEPSDGKIALAQRGRMELSITVHGKSAHAANPQQGDNAIYRMAKIVNELELLNANLDIEDAELGKGCLTVSEITSSANSRSSVADGCTISIDRRLTWGEAPEYALQQICELPSVKAANAIVKPYIFEEASYTGAPAHKECIFFPWKIQKDSHVVLAGIEAHEQIFKTPVQLSTWPFSTNGVAIMGKHGIPVIGYGPGTLQACHVPNEFVSKKQVFEATLFFAAFTVVYASQNKAP